MTPQARVILDHLSSKGSITNLEAQGLYKSRSLSRRITEIHRAGHKILKQHKKDHTGQRYVRYVLVQGR